MKTILSLFITLLASTTFSGCMKRSEIDSLNKTNFSSPVNLGTLPDGRNVTAYTVYFPTSTPSNPNESTSYAIHYIYVVDNAKTTTSITPSGKTTITNVTVENP